MSWSLLQSPALPIEPSETLDWPRIPGAPTVTVSVLRVEFLGSDTLGTSENQLMISRIARVVHVDIPGLEFIHPGGRVAITRQGIDVDSR